MLVDVEKLSLQARHKSTPTLPFMRSKAGAAISLSGTPLAFLRGESGDPNEYVHMAHENAGDREAKRAKAVVRSGLAGLCPAKC